MDRYVYGTNLKRHSRLKLFGCARTQGRPIRRQQVRDILSVEPRCVDGSRDEISIRAVSIGSGLVLPKDYPFYTQL
jgi:hypothetical protein